MSAGRSSAIGRALVLVTVLGLVVGGAAWLARPDAHLHIWFLDTPGDAALLQTPQGGYVLIDGGRDPAQLALHLGERMPFWRRSLDAVILTHADTHRLPGQVAALARYRADLALVPAQFTAPATTQHNGHSPAAQELHTEWWRLVREQETPVRAAQTGARMRLDGAVLTVLATADGDESGVVLRIDYGATSVVFDGAGSEAQDEALLATAQPVTAVAYPWQREIDTPLLAAWQPQALIFTTAQEADEPALRSFHERALHGASLYHPRLNGTIEFISNGRRAWIETER